MDFVHYQLFQSRDIVQFLIQRNRESVYNKKHFVMKMYLDKIPIFDMHFKYFKLSWVLLTEQTKFCCQSLFIHVHSLLLLLLSLSSIYIYIYKMMYYSSLRSIITKRMKLFVCYNTFKRRTSYVSKEEVSNSILTALLYSTHKRKRIEKKKTNMLLNYIFPSISTLKQRCPNQRGRWA